MIRCAITDRSLLGSNEPARFAALISRAAAWANAGIDYIQFREKDLAAASLATLAREILRAIAGSSTKLLINSRADIALATGAHGVHLTASPDELTPAQISALYAGHSTPTISISCHTLAEVERARDAAVDLILFGPIFEKRIYGELIVPGLGVAALREACAAAGNTPVLALGGITEANFPAGLDAGAGGIAGIRLFR